MLNPKTSKQSLPSRSMVTVNIPEVRNINNLDFVYNFYKKDERVNFLPTNLPLEKTPRYVRMIWSPVKISAYELNKSNSESKPEKRGRIEKAYSESKIIYEDDFSPNFMSHTFSDVSSIEQGSADMENLARINRTPYESVFKMATEHVENLSNASDKKDETQIQNVTSLSKTYLKMADFPKTSLGLRIIGGDKKINNDSSEFLESVSEDLSLHTQIDSTLLNDFFRNSKLKSSNLSFEILSKTNQTAMASNWVDQVDLPISEFNSSLNPLELRPVRMLGYIITKYLVTISGFQKIDTFFIEDYSITSYIDKKILYGKTYAYSISPVAEVSMLIVDEDPAMCYVTLASRPKTKLVECKEHVPPPPPNELKFTYDRMRDNLIITWDMPTNPQDDVKQFQVLRRKSIDEPFELIAQYSFDDTLAGDDGEPYKTGEIIDGNNFENMSPEDRQLLHYSKEPVFIHVDNDFNVDIEFSVSSTYIYAICSVDAHGMISNYSTQHEVSFDVYKNSLVNKTVCDEGCPRPYPNMKLKLDAFKDAMRISGDGSRHMTAYFTPEYLKVIDEDGRGHKVVEADAPAEKINPYYVLQLINLDNQKSRLIKIKIVDPLNLTV